jgi:hypothetical protein
MNTVKIHASNQPTTSAAHTIVAGLQLPLDPRLQPSTWSLTDEQLLQLYREVYVDSDLHMHGHVRVVSVTPLVTAPAP